MLVGEARVILMDLVTQKDCDLVADAIRLREDLSCPHWCSF